MRPVYPGQLHLVRRNALNAIFAVDLSKKAALSSVANEALGYVRRGVPVRFGIVPVGDNTAGKIFFYINEKIGREAANDFIKSVSIPAIVSEW